MRARGAISDGHSLSMISDTLDVAHNLSKQGVDKKLGVPKKTPILSTQLRTKRLLYFKK